VRKTKSNVILFLLCLFTASVYGQALNKDIELTVTENPSKRKITDTFKEITLLETDGPVMVQNLTNNIPYKKAPYIRWKPGKTKYIRTADRVLSKSINNGWNVFQLTNQDNLPIVNFRYKLDENNILKLEFEEINPPLETEFQHSRITVHFKSDTADSYLGMGMRFDQCNHYGTIVTNWCDEVGINAPVIAKNKTPEGRDITYAPVPFFVNLKGYGLLLNSYYYSVFDFAKTNANQFGLTNNTSNLNLQMYLGNTPMDIVGSYYKSTGQYKLPKPWVFGVWAAASVDFLSNKTSEEINYSVLKKCRDNRIPLSAIMAEDWYFTFFKFPPLDAWELNRDEYPDYERMIADQHKMGVKHISYFLSYLSEGSAFAESKVFDEAKKEKYFTKNKKGEPYLFDYFVWDEAQIDVSNPKAVDWFQTKFYAQSAKWGCDGWMNDFGEYTPYDSHSYNGELGLTMHNRYPLLWAKMARDFWDKTKPDGDYCFFSRSGYIGQLSNSSFIFTGDRNANYETFSGLGGSIPAVLSGSMSAHPNISIDIGPYNCDGNPPLGKLMMFRWIELGAMIPVMRLHRGLQLCDHWRFDSDKETLEQWKKYATLHAQFFPYIYTLGKQAEDKGWPMLRPLSFYNTTDKQSLKTEYEFLLGDRVLVAPVITEVIPKTQSDMSIARDSNNVYLPEGNWYHYWSNQKFAGKRSYTVFAKPGYLPLFIKEGTILPLFDKPIDTFVEGVEDDRINDFEKVNQSIEIRFYGYGKNKLTLWDGTEIECSRDKGKIGDMKVTNEHNRVYKSVFID
jgi:sulfoquinovosidase